VKKLKGSLKKYLRGIAHGQKPVVFVGQKNLTANVIKAIHESLAYHELIKVKCIDFKEKEQKKQIAEEIEKLADCELVGMIGHILIFFRQHPDPEKRKIILPDMTA
jgi:RNA-binding protein